MHFFTLVVRASSATPTRWQQHLTLMISWAEL